MGIAIHKGVVDSVDDSISLYLRGLPNDGKEKIKEGSLDHALGPRRRR
jgi:hypothetical protein